MILFGSLAMEVIPMKHSAHKADHAVKGKSALKTTVSPRRTHAATTHRAPRTGLFAQFSKTSTRNVVRPMATSHRAPARRAYRSASVSTLAASRLSPTKLVAVLGLTAVVGTGALITTANSSPAAFASSTSSTANTVSAVSFTPSAAGNIVSRSAQRSDSAADTTTTQAKGEWNLEGSATDSIDAQKVSVATASNAAVQQKLQDASITPPSGFNANHDTGDSGNAYSFSQCTWWAYTRRHQLGLPVGSFFGDGAQWAASAKKLGYWVDNNPQVGDIMVFQRGQEGMSSVYGHVAIVEQIVDGNVITSESGANLNGGTFSRTFSNVHDFQYIHF